MIFKKGKICNRFSNKLKSNKSTAPGAALKQLTKLSKL